MSCTIKNTEYIEYFEFNLVEIWDKFNKVYLKFFRLKIHYYKRYLELTNNIVFSLEARALSFDSLQLSEFRCIFFNISYDKFSLSIKR